MACGAALWRYVVRQETVSANCRGIKHKAGLYGKLIIETY